MSVRLAGTGFRRLGEHEGAAGSQVYAGHAIEHPSAYHTGIPPKNAGTHLVFIGSARRDAFSYGTYAAVFYADPVSQEMVILTHGADPFTKEIMDILGEFKHPLCHLVRRWNADARDVSGWNMLPWRLEAAWVRERRAEFLAEIKRIKWEVIA